MSSYQDFIVNTLKNTASDSDVKDAIDNFIVFDNDNNLSGGKIKDLFESMGLTEEVDENGTVTVTGKNSLDSIQTRLVKFQTSISALTARVETLESVKPVITLLGDASITIDQGSTYEDAGATATDNVDGDLTSSIVVGGLPDTNVPGEYTITYNVTDAAGNAAATVTRTVIVPDTTPPVITLLGDASINIDQGSTYEDAGATATDNVDGDLTSSIVVGGLPDTNVPGEYTITYNVTDSAGNAATEVTRTVSVVFNPEGTFYLANEANKYLGAAHQLIYQGLNNRPGALSNVAQGWQELSVVKKSDGYYTLMSYQGPEGNRQYYYLNDNNNDNLNFNTQDINESTSLSVSIHDNDTRYRSFQRSDGKYITFDFDKPIFRNGWIENYQKWTFTVV